MRCTMCMDAMIYSFSYRQTDFCAASRRRHWVLTWDWLASDEWFMGGRDWWGV